jgi:hypothetical protein
MGEAIDIQESLPLLTFTQLLQLLVPEAQQYRPLGFTEYLMGSYDVKGAHQT